MTEAFQYKSSQEYIKENKNRRESEGINACCLFIREDSERTQRKGH